MEVTKISVEWPEFANRLTGVLQKFTEDQFLILNVKRSNRFVQFARQYSGFRVELVSNQFLPPGQQMNERQLACAEQLGWKAPSGTLKTSTPENDPDGSPNHFLQWSQDTSTNYLAELVVKTLIGVLDVPYPGLLEYEAFDEDRGKLLLPGAAFAALFEVDRRGRDYRLACEAAGCHQGDHPARFARIR